MRGLTPASLVPESSGGRVEEACIRPARLTEEPSLTWHPVGAPEPWTEPVAFLDGTQRAEVVAYAGASPLLLADIAAAVRLRRDRRFATVVRDRRRILLGRPEALAAAGPLPEGLGTVALATQEPAHPVRDLVTAGRALDRARAGLEREVGERFRGGSDGWLVVDGTLTESPHWATDRHMLAVSKSHATLPFEGPELERFLRLPAGSRSSIYAPQTRSVTPISAWALRLWPWEGKDVFYGLVRIEVAPENGHPDIADLLSRRLLAERAPLSTPDPRWDRLLYGIHAVERHLRALA